MTERFYIDHGMIHDRVTGKHVDPTPVEFGEDQYDTSPTAEVCELLNQLQDEATGVEHLQSQLTAMREALDAIGKTAFVGATSTGQATKQVALESIEDIARESLNAPNCPVTPNNLTSDQKECRSNG